MSYKTGFYEGRLGIGLGSTMGMGDGNPRYPLDINGDIRLTGSIVNGDGQVLSLVPAESLWTIGNNNLSYAGGNVGIGTSNPATLLTIGNHAFTDGTRDLLRFPSYRHNEAFTIRNNDDVSTGRLEFFWGNSQSSGGHDNTVDNSILTLRNNGNVGIGTTSPGSILTVYDNSPAGEVKNILHVKNSGGYDMVSLGTSSNYNSGAISLYQNSTTKATPTIVINGNGNTYFNGGNVGIGTTSILSYKKLVVHQTGTSHGIYSEGSATQTNYAFAARNSSGNDSWAIRYNGTTAISSDDRLKHNEKNITNALDVIKKIQPVKYFKTAKMFDENFNFEIDISGNPITSEDYHIESGLIAQEVKNIKELQYCVGGGETDISGNKQPYNLNYNDIFVYNIAATQELDRKVIALENENAELKAELAAIKQHLGI